MTQEPHPTAGSTSAGSPARRGSRSRTVKPGRLAVSELAADRPGASSPFGDDITFPLPVESLDYEHAHADPHQAGQQHKTEHPHK